MKNDFRKYHQWKCYLCGGPTLNKKYLGNRQVGEVILKLSIPPEEDDRNRVVLYLAPHSRRKKRDLTSR